MGPFIKGGMALSGGRVLLVDDDPDNVDIVSMYLKRSGFDVRSAFDWSSIDIVRNEPVDLIILDIVLPDSDGFELCQEMRKYTDVPILFLSGKSGDSDKILGLGLGADDFIVKPFSPSELVARVKAQIRRYQGLNPKFEKRRQKLRVADLEIDEEQFIVKVADVPVTLSSKEFKLLMLLAQNPDRIYKPEELYQHVWNSPSFGDSRTVMVHISNLRKKIETDPASPKYIVTIRGVGYKFLPSSNQ